MRYRIRQSFKLFLGHTAGGLDLVQNRVQLPHLDLLQLAGMLHDAAFEIKGAKVAANTLRTGGRTEYAVDGSDMVSADRIPYELRATANKTGRNQNLRYRKWLESEPVIPVIAGGGIANLLGHKLEVPAERMAQGLLA